MAKQKPKSPQNQTPPAQPDAAPGNQPGAPDTTPPSGQDEGHARTVRVVPVLRITAKRQGFRRAGFAFSDILPRDIPLSDLIEAQVEQLLSERMLNCVRAEVEVDTE